MEMQRKVKYNLPSPVKFVAVLRGKIYRLLQQLFDAEMMQ